MSSSLLVSSCHCLLAQVDSVAVHACMQLSMESVQDLLILTAAGVVHSPAVTANATCAECIR